MDVAGSCPKEMTGNDFIQLKLSTKRKFTHFCTGVTRLIEHGRENRRFHVRIFQGAPRVEYRVGQVAATVDYSNRLWGQMFEVFSVINHRDVGIIVRRPESRGINVREFISCQYRRRGYDDDEMRSFEASIGETLLEIKSPK